MPPEYVLAGRSAAAVRSNHSSSSAARARAPARPRSSSVPKSTRFWRPERSSSTDAYWPVRPIDWRTRSASLTTSKPPMRAWPASGTSRVDRMRTAVVLPAPLGPSTPRTVPRATARSTPWRAFVSPKCLTRPSASITRSCVMAPAWRDALTAHRHAADTAGVSGTSAHPSAPTTDPRTSEEVRAQSSHLLGRCAVLGRDVRVRDASGAATCSDVVSAGPPAGGRARRRTCSSAGSRGRPPSGRGRRSRAGPTRCG